MKKLLPGILVSLLSAMAATPVHAASTYAQTRYPIVFSHGLFGFASLGPIEYWNGIPADLRSNGANVFVTGQSPVNSNDVRGEQLLAQVQDIQAITGAAKVNLIGHSQGGMTVRYVAAVAPSRVASVTSVGTPHKGTPVADAVSGLSNLLGPVPTSVVAGVVNAVFQLVDVVDGGKAVPADALAAMKNLSTPGAQAFNSRFPQGIPVTACGSGAAQVNGVRYFSMGGTGLLTSGLDPSDYGLKLASVLHSEANDGMVGRCSNHLGVVVRDNFNMNHLDEANQLFGLVSIFETNPKTMYREHANRLKNAGL